MHAGATKRPEGGMNGRRALLGDESVFAAHAAKAAVHRKSVARQPAAAYSSVQRSTTNRKDRTMTKLASPAISTISTPARVAAFIGAVLMSATVLGATVSGMQAGAQREAPQVVELERATISATAVN
jgi:hypothetical protein